MRFLKRFPFLVFGVLCMHLTAGVTKLHFEHINTENGLSNNRVYNMYQDQQGFLWFATLDGLNRYDGYSFKVYKNIPGDSLSLQDNRILFIYEDSHGFFWLGTQNNGLNRFNLRNETFKQFNQFKNNSGVLPSINIDLVKEDKDGNLFAYAGTSLFQYDYQTRQFNFIHDSATPNSYSEEFKQITNRIKDKYGIQVLVQSVVSEKEMRWINTHRHGLYIEDISQQNPEIERYTYPPFDNKIETKCIFKDNAGIIWVCTKNRGVFKHNPHSRKFVHFSSFPVKDEIIEDVTVRAITEGHDGSLWIGTYNIGLLKFNQKQNTFTLYQNKEGDQNSLPNNMVRSLYTMPDGTIWVGTYGGVSKYNPKSDNFTNYLPKNSNEVVSEVTDSNHLYFNRVYNFATDYFGNLWIANWEGLSRLNIKTNKFAHYPKEYFGVDNIRKVYVDRNNSIWIGCEYGGLVRLNPLTGDFNRYMPEDNLTSLANQNVFSIYEANNGTFWITTFNGVSMLDRATDKFVTYTTKDGLAGNMTYGIMEDELNRLWITTTTGLSMFDVANKEFKNFTEDIGIQNNEFTEGAFYKRKLTGEMIVGGINGFNIFKPEEIAPNNIPPKVALTNLKILNKTVDVSNEEGNILQQGINFTDDITLKNSDKIISLEFSALHYAIPDKNQFQYKLEGFNETWVNADYAHRYATYTNLPQGKYIFKLRAANYDGIWSESADLLTITILPPYWKTWWAYTIYAVLIAVLLLAFRKYSMYSLQIKNQLKLEKLKREKADEINKMKLDFFTNVSHEFRTPLSLILSPVENLINAPCNAYIGNFRDQLHLVNNNAKKMLQLTNQILDLRKLELGRMDIRVEETPMVLFTRRVVLNFKELALHRGIKFDYFHPGEEIFAWVDRDKMEKVIYNLLSNALKFTHDNTGIISVKIETNSHFDVGSGFLTNKISDDKHLVISVKDNGIGIPAGVLKKIFKQFYRVDNMQTLSIQGSGIGLALAKELVGLHKGAILVQSHENEGSMFSVILPLGKGHFNVGQVNENGGQVRLQEEKGFVANKDILLYDKGETERKDKAQTLLIAEDNHELRSYICSLLNDTYNIVEADNGQTGFQKAIDFVPDLIISDIMMPVKNGIDFCNAIKNDVRTSHIPFVLLTAKTSDEHRLEGFEAKADEFITKPFNTRMLLLRVKNLLEARGKLQDAVSQKKEVPAENKLKINPLDKEFLENIEQVITQNLSDYNFNVEQLSKIIGMSRSNLHLKLKALTKQPASEFIRSIRLSVAMELLKGQRKNVNEIAYEVGFNTPSYFIKCFKEKFGVTPKEFMANLA